jgi:hypothetical protein
MFFERGDKDSMTTAVFGFFIFKRLKEAWHNNKNDRKKNREFKQKMSMIMFWTRGTFSWIVSQAPIPPINYWRMFMGLLSD